MEKEKQEKEIVKIAVIFPSPAHGLPLASYLGVRYKVTVIDSRWGMMVEEESW